MILLAHFYNSWIYGSIAILGVTASTLMALALKADRDLLEAGLFGFNAALTAIALGGFFLVLAWRSLFYAMFGAIVSTWLWASIAIILQPIGMPVLSSAFVLVTWLMLLGQYGFAALVLVAPADATTPEGNLEMYRLASGS